MLELNIKDFRKSAKIKFSKYPDGYIFSVHRLGAGAELELSSLTREASKVISKLQADPNDKEIGKLYDKITELNEKQLIIKASVFDDGKDGSIALALVKELADDEVVKILEAVESQTDIPEAPEAPETPEAQEVTDGITA